VSGRILHTLRCDHCKREFASEYYGPQTCPPCKSVGHYDGLAAYCRLCKVAN